MTMNPMQAFVTRCVASMCLAVAACQSLAGPAVIRLEVGQQKTWAQAREISRAATGDPSVVGINVVPPRGVVLTATQPGTAMVSVWEGTNPLPATQFQVVVSPNLGAGKRMLEQQAAGAQVDNAGTSLRLSGNLTSLDSHDNMVKSLLSSTKNRKTGEVAATIQSQTADEIVDASKSAFDVQVRIDIKIVEVSRTRLKEAGFYGSRTSSSGRRGFGGPGSTTGLVNDPTLDKDILYSANGFVPFSDAFNFFYWGNSSKAIFSALETNGFAYTLAEPSLTALSGQTATFLAGGELPIPLRTGSGADSGISVDYKQFGIRLGLTPTVLDANRIAIKVAPEVSELDESLSVTLSGFTIPGLRVRRTETTVALADGETFVISGLVSRETSSTVDKFPVLGDIPILGAFFRSNRFNRDDKELIMIATPHLVRPFAKNARLPNLPGEEVKDYNPGFMRFLLLESGHYNQNNGGFSQ